MDVAMITDSPVFAARRAQSRTEGIPPKGSSAFPGKRVDANLDWMTTQIRGDILLPPIVITHRAFHDILECKYDFILLSATKGRIHRYADSF